MSNAAGSSSASCGNGGVGKAQVLALKAIVEDVGADRGVVFTEHGFQTGARAAARGTNLLLQTSLDEFKQTARLDGARVELALKQRGRFRGTAGLCVSGGRQAGAPAAERRPPVRRELGHGDNRDRRSCDPDA